VCSSDLVVAMEQSPTSARVVRLGLDGVLRDAHDFEGFTGPKGLVGLDDGGLLLLGAGAVARIDEAMRVVWSQSIEARAAIVVDGDYVFAGNPLRLAPANASGIEVVRTSPSGEVRWQSFATPGPGTHTIAGLALVGGDLAVACGNESTDTRSTANQRPFFVSRFDPSTGDHRATGSPYVDLRTPEGDQVSLAFGTGLGVEVVDGVLHVGAVINAGGPGAVRTSTVARIEGDAVFGRSLGGRFTLADDGVLVGANLFDRGPLLTRMNRLDGEGPCYDDTIAGVLAPIEVITIRDAGGIAPAAVQDGVPVSDLVIDRPNATRTVDCGG
jgi:hypothetical protein